MNKNLHRIVFNAARATRMVVQENAKSAGKATGATSGVLGIATVAVLALTPAHAQIAAAPNAPGNQRPNVLVAPNGVPVINIVTPSAAGVSRNTYRQFDVNAQGAIFNNSRTAVQSQLGGFLAANPWLASGSARVILNEVNSSSPSYLRGPLEVAGSRAEVVIANPSGIQVDGATFINSNRVTLTTGVPQLNAFGGIENYRVTGGTIGVSGAGLDVGGTEFAALYARMVSINAGVWGGGELRVVTGSNQVSADSAPGVAANVVPIAGTGPTPPLAFDSGALGGMYSQKIWIMGTEAGVGARNAGIIQTGAGNAALMGLGELVVTSSGHIENIGTVQAAGNASITAPTFANSGTVRSAGSAKIATQGDLSNVGTIEGQRIELASAGGDVVNSGTLRQTSTAALTIAAPVLSNMAGGVIGAEPAPAAPPPGDPRAGSGDLAGSGSAGGEDPATPGDTSPGGGAGSGTATPDAPANVPPAPGTITAANGTIRNDSGRIYAGGPITLQTPQINNAGGSLSVASMALTGPVFSNAGGTLNVSNSFSANVGQFDNTQGRLQAGSLDITTTGDLLNQDGTLASNGDVTLKVGGNANNQRGAVTAAGTLNASAAGTIDNSGGRLAGNGQDQTLQSSGLVNTGGQIEHAGSGTLNITAGSYSGANGKIISNGALAATIAGDFNQDGGSTYARRITLDAGTLSNQGGEIVQSGTDAMHIAARGGLNNNAGTIASNGDTTIEAGHLTNEGGAIRSAGTSNLALTVGGSLDNSSQGEIGAGGDVALNAGSLNNDGGRITAAENLTSTTSGATSNRGGTLAANGNVTLVADSLNDDGGQIAAVSGDLVITTMGTTINVGGTLQAGGATTLRNAGLDNTTGKIFGDSLSVDTHGQQFTNAQGTLASTTTIGIQSGALVNNAGLIQSGGAMVIDTHGQALVNTNTVSNGDAASGAATGILSGHTLHLNVGDMGNTAGLLGAANQLTINSRSFTNAGGGQVVSQSDIAIDTQGGTFDNTGGQIQAMGDLTLSAGRIDNTNGLLRSTATANLNAGTLVNSQTQGIDQGIEAQDIAINAYDVANVDGAIRANGNINVTSGGTIDNTAGLISAGDTLALKDPNASNPAGKTLNLINTAGTLVATELVDIDAAGFSGDGQLVSGNDLSIALTQDLVNNAEVIANGNLSYSTTGNLTNNGKLLAGQTLTVGGNVVENTADAEMSGTHTVVNAGTLNNRGLIDSAGSTRIDAGTVNNLGTGRIYGDAISISAGTLNNDAEVVNGVTSSGTIASRGTLDIGASVANNREHALIFSGGDMAIGDALDGNRKATGQGTELNNLSATIESLGAMSISMAQIDNHDVHIQKGPQETTTTGPVLMIGIDGLGFFTPDQVIAVPGSPIVYERNPDGSPGAILTTTGWGYWYTTTKVTEDTAVDADPSRIVSGGDMTLDGSVHNLSSKIIAGGTLFASDVNNEGLKGTRKTETSATVIDYLGQVQPPVNTTPQLETSDLGKYAPVQHLDETSERRPDGASVGATGAVGGGAAGASGGTGPGTIVEVAAGVSSLADSDGQTTSIVVRTRTPDLSVPSASLFSTQPGAGSRYLIETDPRFANYRNWLGSDYLLNALGYDPNSVQKRLGDGFYEQKLIREQVAQLTGYRYLDGFDSDEAQYAALMNAGATFAQQYGLRPGIALTAAQMAQLTSDIVWLVEQTVTLPDGSTQNVLVPQVYVRVRPGDIDGSGALLSANATVIQGSGDLVNTGTIAGRSMVSISADNVNNLLGGRINGGSVGINAKNDINNIGSSITADNAALLTAGRDINIRSTTQTTTDGTHGGSNLDQIAGVYVSNPNGVLIASAGRDVNLIASAMISGGAVAVGAGRDINLGTVTESSTASVSGQNGAGIATQSREIGSAIVGGGDVRLAAGNDLNIRAGAVASAEGSLVATAANDINLTAGQATSSVATATAQTSGGLLKKTTTSTFDSTSTTEVLSSSLSGNTVALVAGNDINAQAAQLRSEGATSVFAGRDINFTTANRTTEEAHASQSQTSATGLGRALGTSLAATGHVANVVAGAALMGGHSATGTESSTRTDAIGTTVSAGSLQMVSGRDTTLQAATVVADGNITMVAGRNLTIESAQSTSTGASSDASGQSGSIGTWYNPSVGNVKTSEANAGTRTSQVSSQVASLQGNVTLVAGETYRQSASSVLAAGLAGPLVGGDVTVLAKNVLINEAYNTEQTVSVARGSSTILGGSASIGGISTDSIRSAQNTVNAMGDTNDGRMQALGAVNLAMSGKQAYDTAASLASGGGVGYKVSVNVSRNQSQSTSFSNSSEAVGSSIVGANNVNIIATGGSQDSNIHAIGSTIAAGNTVNLAADNAITLEASRNVRESAGVNSSSGASVGVGYAMGSQNGFTIELAAARGKGNDNQNDITHNNTRVSGGKAVNIVSGGDLTLKGAVVEANRVDADVGSNLNIESLRDVSVGQSRQSSSGVNASLCIPPICYGVSTVGGNAASAKADGVFVGVGEQSGIKAGDGGFDVKVKGDTTLVGAVIESTQAAIDAGKNNFKTDGTLTMSDLQNVSQSSGSSYAVSGNVGFMAGGAGDQQSAMGDKGMSDRQIATASDTKPGGGAGVGSSSSSQGSVTKSGISGVAGDDTVRTGDDSSAGTLIKDWNTQAIVKDVQGQAVITQEFGQKASSAWGQYANSQLVEALANDDKEAAACWGDGGSCRVAGHTLIGGLTGGGAGAAGAGVGAVTVSSIGDAITGLGLSGAAADAVTAGLAAALGSAAGGASGAAGAFNEAANNYLSSGQVREMMDKLREAPSQAERDKILKDYAALSAEQSAAIAGCTPAECERIAADVQGGRQALNSAKSELQGLAGGASNAEYDSILGTQKNDQQFFFSLGNGWIDSNGQPLDVASQMRATGKNMADNIATAATYSAAGCALTVICAPAIPVINSVGYAATAVGGLIFDPDPASTVIDFNIDKAIAGVGNALKIPAIVTTPIAEGIKSSQELKDWKNQLNLEP